MGVFVTDADVAGLRLLVQLPSTSAEAKRAARVILALGQPGGSFRSVAAAERVSKDRIGEYLAVYRSGGVVGVGSLTRSAPQRGRPSVSAEVRKRVLELGRRTPPLRIREIAAMADLSVGKVCEILKPLRRGRPSFASKDLRAKD